MNWQRAGERLCALGTVTILALAIGATTGRKLFAQSKSAEPAGHARMQQIADRQAIEQLLMGDYPRALDSANWKALQRALRQGRHTHHARRSHQADWPCRDRGIFHQDARIRRPGCSVNSFALPGSRGNAEDNACGDEPLGTHRRRHGNRSSLLGNHCDHWGLQVGGRRRRTLRGHLETRRVANGNLPLAKIFDDLPPRTSPAAGTALQPKP